MKVRVKLFATLTRHAVGVAAGRPFEVELAEGATVQDLVDHLALPTGEVKLVFVNARAQPFTFALKADDEVGLFPPVGGG